MAAIAGAGLGIAVVSLGILSGWLYVEYFLG
jgi:hypothetical protein